MLSSVRTPQQLRQLGKVTAAQASSGTPNTSTGRETTQFGVYIEEDVAGASGGNVQQPASAPQTSRLTRYTVPSDLSGRQIQPGGQTEPGQRALRPDLDSLTCG